MIRLPIPSSFTLDMPNGARIIAVRRDDLGIDGLYEYRRLDTTKSHFELRFWRLELLNSRGDFILENVTTDILRRLLTGLAQSKARRKTGEERPPVGPETKPGMAREEIPDQATTTGSVRVTRRISTIERLVRQKAITRRHASGAERLYAAYVVGIEGANVSEEELPPGVRTANWLKSGPSFQRSAAAQEYYRAINVLGPDLGGMVMGLIVGDLPLSVLASRRRWDRRKTLGYVRAGLEVVVIHFEQN